MKFQRDVFSGQTNRFLSFPLICLKKNIGIDETNTVYITVDNEFLNQWVSCQGDDEKGNRIQNKA